MYDESTLKILRQRVFGYDHKHDSSRDNELQQLEPREVLEHLTAWELGSSSWLSWFIHQVEKVGGGMVIPSKSK